MPAATAQNRNAVSEVSLIAVRKRTMDSAPTIPKDKAKLEVIVKTIIALMALTNRSVMQ